MRHGTDGCITFYPAFVFVFYGFTEFGFTGSGLADYPETVGNTIWLGLLFISGGIIPHGIMGF